MRATGNRLAVTHPHDSPIAYSLQPTAYRLPPVGPISQIPGAGPPVMVGERVWGGRKRFAGTATEPGTTGCLLLLDALGDGECRVVGERPAGDHSVIIGEVVAASVRGDGAPLTMREAGFRYFG